MARRMLAGAAAVLVVAAVGAGVGGLWRPTPDTITVQPGDPVGALAAAHPGATLQLAAGRHPGFSLNDRVTVEGQAGATTGPIEVRVDGVRLRSLEIRGGDTALLVRDAHDVAVEDVVIGAAELHGIEVIQGSARITGCRIEGLRSDQAQGIEIRNTNGHGRTVIEGCRVAGGQEGIVSHVARLEVRDNVVSGTTMRGIAITEMSEGLVERNQVESVTGAGIYCGDEAHCEIRGNTVRQVEPVPGGARSQQGQAVVGWYYSTLRLSDNHWTGVADPAVDVYRGSVTVERFPLSHWPPGWRGAVPGLGVTAWALVALVGARLAVVPWLRRRRAPTREEPPAPHLGWWALATVLFVQILHVGEHGVQVHQTFVAQAEDRRGLAGAAVDTEWLHLGFNAMVLVGIGVSLWLARHELRRRADGVQGWLLAAALVQMWHVAEHVARVAQYLDRGVSPAPGILGGRFDLVWFHYGINMTVIVGLVIAAALLVNGWAADRRSEQRPQRRLLHLVGAGAG